MAYAKKDFDTLECPVCETVVAPSKVAAGPVVHYKCSCCGTSWRINSEGDQTHFRASRRAAFATTKETKRVAKPICPNCGSEKVFRPGFCSFRYTKGEWRMERGSPELADTECLNCQGCGATLNGGFDPPFSLVVEEPYSKRR